MLLADEEIDVFGDGEQRRDFTYVDDAVDAFLLAAARDEARGAGLQPRRRGTSRLRELAEMLIGSHGERVATG